jgi:hypothetical protein
LTVCAGFFIPFEDPFEDWFFGESVAFFEVIIIVIEIPQCEQLPCENPHFLEHHKLSYTIAEHGLLAFDDEECL